MGKTQLLHYCLLHYFYDIYFLSLSNEETCRVCDILMSILTKILNCKYYKQYNFSGPFSVVYK